MKKCFKCGIEKDLKEFYKHQQMLDGYLNKCIECTKKDVKGSNYDNTEKGVVRVLYKTQVRNSKVRKMDLPNYTKEEFKEWLYKNDFKTLYDNWVNSNFNKNKKPSADRLDDFKPYSLNNIRLVTWEENKLHQHYDILNAIGTGGQRCKTVIQLDKNGNILAEYHSFSHARRTVGYSMEKNIKLGNPSRKDGTYWKYKA